MLCVFAASLNLLSNDDENISARDDMCRCDALRFFITTVSYIYSARET